MAEDTGPEDFEEVDSRTAARIAHNEVALRTVNEAIENGRVDHESAGFVCECGRLGCTEVVELSTAEYERVRADSARFVLAPGHATPVDVVIERHDGFEVAQKTGVAEAIAEVHDPRAGDEEGTHG